MFRFQILSSGSNGNISLLQTDSANILIDCGRGIRFIEDNLDYFNIKPSQINAVLITHAHTDHLHPTALKFLSNNGIPIYSDNGVFDDIFSRFGGEKTRDCKFKFLDSRFKTKIADAEIECFNVYHSDARISQTLGFAIDIYSNGHRYKIGYATDTGKICKRIISKLTDCFLLAIETNYDEKMLETSFRPQENKNWISSDKGHLSNKDAAKAIAEIKKASARPDALKYVFLSHISQQHNNIDLPLQAVRQEFLRQELGGINLFVAKRDSKSVPVEI